MKKITAFLSALVLLTSMFSLCASAGEYLYGDVDMNGKIDILDVITLNKAILGKESLSKEASALADVDGDGMPTSTDALQIMKYIVGLITEFENSAVIQPEIIQDAKIYNNHRYQLFDIGMTWTEAKAYCENLGGHLMTISSPEETDTVLDIFSQSSKQLLWLGGYYDEEASGWKWVDDSEFDYTNWDDYAPDRQTRNDQTEAYMMTYKKPNPSSGISHSEAYKWNDIFEDGCFPGEEDFFSTENYCFICEWDS